MPKEPKLTYVHSDDWAGLYVDGECAVQNHSLDAGDVISALGLKLESIECDSDWLQSLGQLPEDLNEVKRSE